MPGDPTRAYASMGNYVFNAKALIAACSEASRARRKGLRPTRPAAPVPDATASTPTISPTNRVPGVRDYEEPAYWRDVGTIDAYFEAHQDLLGAEPRFNLFNPRVAYRLEQLPGAVTRR